MPQTVNAPIANRQSLARVLLREQTKRATRKLNPAGLFLLDTGLVTVPASALNEAGDKVVILEFPGNCRLVDFEAELSDLDNGITLVHSLVLVNADATETALVSGSTKGQAGGIDRPDSTVPILGLDASDGNLEFQVDTGAGSPVAGTIQIRALLWFGSALENW